MQAESQKGIRACRISSWSMTSTRSSIDNFQRAISQSWDSDGKRSKAGLLHFPNFPMSLRKLLGRSWQKKSTEESHEISCKLLSLYCLILFYIYTFVILCWHWSSFPSEWIGWAFRATWNSQNSQNSQQSREMRQIVQILVLIVLCFFVLIVLCFFVFFCTLSSIQKAIFLNAAVGFLEEIMKTNERNRLQIHCVFHAACSSLRSEKPNLSVSQSGFALGCFLHGSPGDLSQSEGLGREVDTHTHTCYTKTEYHWLPDCHFL